MRVRRLCGQNCGQPGWKLCARPGRGASPNVVVASMSESRGHSISFGRFLRYGVPATLLTMLVATVDVMILTALA